MYRRSMDQTKAPGSLATEVYVTPTMVAISLYRGNLHRVPDVPRRWLMPDHTISKKDFRCLLRRRSLALSRSVPATTSNPIPPKASNSGTAVEGANCAGPSVKRELDNPVAVDCTGGASKGIVHAKVKEEAECHRGLSGGECLEKKAGGVNGAPCKDPVSVDCRVAAHVLTPEKTDERAKNPEPVEKAGVPNDKGKWKKEVEEKLQVLNAKKHNLVLVLKQILNTEEELRRQNPGQGMAIRPSVPLQVDVTNDSGSMYRHPTPRTGSERNHATDVEGGGAEDSLNHNIQSRPFLRVSSTSPSPDSQLRRPALSQVPHNSRTSIVVSGSPSRFAPQGHSPHLTGVSLSGTNYATSSPSPAASGGTSAFKDARQPSPWN
ncbi:hypothetical protein SAY86_006283 [Trapa natans]|uniref:Uncharacterized protein n=1 Tax=Trapa natans TaxID=22666 RepID=A0AAN7L578_TRANT|nr:hypothetical protein SAY86_006283 [Trapa natans]